MVANVIVNMMEIVNKNINIVNPREIFEISNLTDMEINIEKVGNSKIPIIYIDNYYKNPEKVIDFSLTLPYTNDTSVIHNYPGLRSTIKLNSFNVMSVLKYLFKFYNIDMKIENIEKSLYHFNLMKSDKELNKLQTYPHIDGIGGFAGIVYLNKPEECNGGTAFYRYKKTKTEKPETMMQFNKILNSINTTYKNYIIDSNEDWDIIFKLSMKFNRVVFYPNDVFHSAYIKRNDYLKYYRHTQTYFFRKKK